MVVLPAASRPGRKGEARPSAGSGGGRRRCKPALTGLSGGSHVHRGIQDCRSGSDWAAGAPQAPRRLTEHDHPHFPASEHVKQLAYGVAHLGGARRRCRGCTAGSAGAGARTVARVALPGLGEGSRLLCTAIKRAPRPSSRLQRSHARHCQLGDHQDGWPPALSPIAHQQADYHGGLCCDACRGGRPCSGGAARSPARRPGCARRHGAAR